MARDPSFEVVGEAATARDAIETVQAQQPDLVLIDIVLRGLNGIVATRELHRLGTKSRILMLTAIAEPGFVVDALAAGANGYALKEQSTDELIDAMHTVHRGGSYVAPGLKAAVDGVGASPQTGGMDALSARERQVFELVVAGYPNLRVASELFISIKTVETHRSRINKKLRVHSTGELIRFAALNGLIST